jgi:heptosyltransferase-2
MVRLFGWLSMRQSPAEPVELAQVQRVMVVRTDEIGDVVLNVPLLRELRRVLPRSHITLVVKPALLGLMKNCPYVDEVRSYDCSMRYAVRFFLLPWRVFRMAKRELRGSRFDLALLPRREVDLCYAAFLIFLSGARWRVSYSEFVNPRKHCLNPGFDRLFTHVFPEQPGPVHEVEHNLNLLRYLGATVHEDHTELWTSSEDENAGTQLLRQSGIDAQELLIGLCPGAATVLKQWPIDNFTQLARLLRERHNCSFLVFGGSADVWLGQTIESNLGCGVVNLAGVTSLPQTAAILKRCRLLITNDTGPMHMAVAVGVPVIAIFGSSCEHRFGPWKHQTVISTNLACRPCQQSHVLDRCMYCIYDRPRCLHDLSVDSVFRASNMALARVSPVACSN